MVAHRRADEIESITQEDGCCHTVFRDVLLTDGVLEDVVSVLTEVDGEGRDHERNSCT